MEAKLYFFKVFTEQAKSGNPAACALLSQWPDTALLQQIAFEADQVVTAFVVPAADSPYQYHIRWFSRAQEINLCGHGTLAAAALLRQLKGEGSYSFLSQYGELTIQAQAQSLQMSLPQWHSDVETAVELPAALLACQPVDYFQTRDLVLVLADEQAVTQFQPDVELIRLLPQHALIVTAFSAPATYVLRYFAPAIGIDEDIATGSAQCSLAPYWFEKSGLAELHVRQCSAIPASFSMLIDPDLLQLKTQAVNLPHLTRLIATIA
ncbi:PhzF family phenazine biosynthesis protein [Rheinheimera mangrovi]|uniref:PhzF family phenazine biosynthesis protein n=1 Tax=Rheinheimera mangrovi TaxID=2498451 RepID=UPI000F8D4343|nr:PhzF family phenazine biosynthesis isomerase [Rheinheimera mangrovi]